MNDMLLMQVVKSQQSLTEYISAAVLRVLSMHACYQRRQSIVHDLDEDPETTLELIGVKDLQYNMVLLAHVHETHLIVHELVLSLILQVLDEFERDFFTIRLPLHTEYFSKSTRAKLVLAGDLIELRRIFSFEISVGG